MCADRNRSDEKNTTRIYKKKKKKCNLTTEIDVNISKCVSFSFEWY